MKNDWTRSLFNSFYVKTEGLALSDELTKRECQLAIQLLELQPQQQILDLACGHGRHSIELARQGFLHVLGLDFNQAAIIQAQHNAQNTSAKFIQGDMTKLDYTGEFDVVLSLFHSMFYWDHATHLDILCGVHRALKPGGRLLLDSYNPFAIVHRKLLEQHPVFGTAVALHHHLRRLRAQLRHVFGGGRTTWTWHETQTTFDPRLGRVQGKKIMHIGAKRQEHSLDVRVYTVTEVEQLLHQAGFQLEQVVSNTGGMLTASSPRFLLVAKK
jgi:SAM-dependent methyltransferase